MSETVLSSVKWLAVLLLLALLLLLWLCLSCSVWTTEHGMIRQIPVEIFHKYYNYEIWWWCIFCDSANYCELGLGSLFVYVDCRAVNRSGIETISQHDVLYVHPICSPLQAMLQHAVIAPYDYMWWSRNCQHWHVIIKIKDSLNSLNCYPFLFSTFLDCKSCVIVLMHFFFVFPYLSSIIRCRLQMYTLIRIRCWWICCEEAPWIHERGREHVIPPAR